MNRFRSRKKSQGEVRVASGRPSLDADVPPPMPSFSRTFKRNKKAAPEPTPEFDLASVLPPSDDFRTSLLMPKLSARFSMLKEQDDPTSKIGKANDDSVLFPKRASRLDLFNRKGLSDIAEVDSVRGSIRPPFASTRLESFSSDGYGTDDNSVMSRSRPGEGNTMFGGRQKIFKIPVGGAGSVKNFGTTEDGQLPSGGNMGGKALYESDISMSAFQRLREQERQEKQEQENANSSISHGQVSKEQERSGSPPLAKYNRNRETSSSTNSGPSQPRTSTAATSLASQRSINAGHENLNGSSPALPPSTQPSSANSDRPFPKGKRLYGHGLDQHMYEQQSSALHRLESLHRQRSVGSRPLPRNFLQSKSATNLADRYHRGGLLYASNDLRTASPPPSATPPRMADFDLGLTNENPNGMHTDSGYGQSPPLSPSMSPRFDPNGHDATLVAALEPNDVGKATASGAFNKPKKQYDEQQYLQRQLQLQEDRNTPSPQLVRPFSPPAASLDEQTTALTRNNSLGSTLSRSGSLRRPWEHHMEDRILRAVPERGGSPSIHRESDDHKETAMDRSFFGSTSEASSVQESEHEVESNSTISVSNNHLQSFSSSTAQQTQPRPVELNHQLNFNPGSNHLTEPTEDAFSDSRSFRSGTTITQAGDPALEKQIVNAITADSPTLGPVGVQNGLSGLIRAHLRNDSGQSSLCPEESPRPINFPEARGSIFGHQSALHQHHQDTWGNRESNEQDRVGQKRTSDQSSNAGPPSLSFAARHILEQATALREQDSSKAKLIGPDKAQRILGGEAPRRSHEANASWQDQFKAHHARGGSTETQKEKEALEDELAERRRLIVQRTLKTHMENESRSSSPARAIDGSPARPIKPFGLLKKTSKGSLIGKQEKPSKAMKMLGIDPNTNFESHQSPIDMFMGREQLSDRAMPPRQRGPPQSRRLQDARQNSNNTSPYKRQRELPDQENQPQRPSPRSSKSGSNYSDSSANSRKGSTIETSVDRSRPNGYGPNEVANGSQLRSSRDLPRPAQELMQSMARHGISADRTASAYSDGMRNNIKAATSGYPGQRIAPPGIPQMINPAQRPSASPYKYNARSTPSLSNAHDSSYYVNSSAPQSPNRSNIRPQNFRKRSVNKNDISDPRFLSCTSSVDTVELPPGASLRNGMDLPPQVGSTPPIPARDSRRKRTQTLLQALGRTEKEELTRSMPSANAANGDIHEEPSGFSADDEPAPRSMRQDHLRRTSSEGAHMYQRARQQLVQPLGTVMPSPPYVEENITGVGHFPYQAQKDVPASAVMF